LLKKLTDVIPVIGSTILFGSVTDLYKKVTSVIRCCQTTVTVCGTTGTSGTCGTSFRVLVVLRVLQVHGHCNLIGNAKQHHNAYQALVFVIRSLPNNISRRHCAYFDKIKNPPTFVEGNSVPWSTFVGVMEYYTNSTKLLNISCST